MSEKGVFWKRASRKVHLLDILEIRGPENSQSVENKGESDDSLERERARERKKENNNKKKKKKKKIYNNG